MELAFKDTHLNSSSQESVGFQIGNMNASLNLMGMLLEMLLESPITPIQQAHLENVLQLLHCVETGIHQGGMTNAKNS